MNTQIIDTVHLFAANCGGVKTAIDYGCNGDGPAVSQLLLAIINFMAVGVGIAVVAGIVFAGIRYMTANGNVAQSEQAKVFIASSVAGLILFIFMFAILNFLIPGGLFNS